MLGKGSRVPHKVGKLDPSRMVRAPTRAKNRRKAAVKIQKKTATLDSTHDPFNKVIGAPHL